MENQDSSRAFAAFAVVASVAIAFLIRVIPAYGLVFAHGIVDFQEPDAWYHLRTVHNLLAHFPYRSGFDPYAFYPNGGNISTGPVWDYLLATPAWILGWGAPSAWLIDHVAAWLPAILGSLYPIPAFFVARRLFGPAAGMFAALWTAAGTGAFLWITHLGLADHHAAEGLFAFLTLAWMCAAVDGGGLRFAWMSGIALGLFMGTRPAGIFVPATLTCLVLLAPSTASAVLRAVLAAALVFLPMSGNHYSWLALGAAGVLSCAVLVLEAVAQRKNWPPVMRRLVPFAAAALGFAAAVVAMPHVFGSLWHEIRRVTGGEARIVGTVQELQPIYRAGRTAGWSSIFEVLGLAWIPAFPVLVGLLLRRSSTASLLLALWTCVMAIGTVVMARMSLYFLPVAFVLAGAACGWITDHIRPASRRRVLAAVLAILVLAINVPLAALELRHDGGLNADWVSAFAWLRDNTPEPMADAGAWSRYYPSMNPGASRPSGNWGVAIWWDYGYAMEFLSHRIPMSNGEQLGGDEMARFFTETNPEAAVDWLRRSGARYVVVDPLAPLLGRSRFPVLIRILGRDLDSYTQTLVETDVAGVMKAVPVYLPTYYQTMTARLYLADGEAVDGKDPWVFETEPAPGPGGGTVQLIVSSRHFASEIDAAAYLKERPGARLIMGCVDPGRSCVTLPAVKGLKRVFSSDPLPLSANRAVRAVKIFQVMPAQTEQAGLE